MIKIVQVNLGRGYAATKECLAAAETQGASILLLQEPYVGNKCHLNLNKRVIQKAGSSSTNPVKAAIFILGTFMQVKIEPDLVTENAAFTIGSTKLGLASLYWEGTVPINTYLEQQWQQWFGPLYPRGSGAAGIGW